MAEIRDRLLVYEVQAMFGCLRVALYLTAAVVLLSVFLVYLFDRSHRDDVGWNCRTRINQLGIYVALYESGHNSYPPDLSYIWKPALANDANLFVCREREDAHFNASDRPRWDEVAARSDVEYRPPPEGMSRESFRTWPMLWERNRHGEDPRFLIYADGRVEVLDEAAFQRALSR